MELNSESVGFIIVVLIFLSGLWWRVESAIGTAKSEALREAKNASAVALFAQTQLAEHRLHVAENYITKAGLTERTEPIMAGLASLKNSFDQMNQRLDRVIENSHQIPVKPRPSQNG